MDGKATLFLLPVNYQLQKYDLHTNWCTQWISQIESFQPFSLYVCMLCVRVRVYTGKMQDEFIFF